MNAYTAEQSHTLDIEWTPFLSMKNYNFNLSCGVSILAPALCIQWAGKVCIHHSTIGGLNGASNNDAACFAISGGAQIGSGLLGASNSRNQASRAAKAQEKANRIGCHNRARLMVYQDEQRIKLHNYKVDRYKEFIPRAYDRANLPIKTIMQPYRAYRPIPISRSRSSGSECCPARSISCSGYHW